MYSKSRQKNYRCKNNTYILTYNYKLRQETLLLTLSHAGFWISDSNLEYSMLSYNIVSNFQINNNKSPIRKIAPEILSPIFIGSGEPGGHPLINIQLNKLFCWLSMTFNIHTPTRCKQIKLKCFPPKGLFSSIYKKDSEYQLLAHRFIDIIEWL